MIQTIIYIYVFCLGTVIGSFLNVLIYRFPRNISVVKGYSHCTTCDTRLKAKDLVPILSWLSLKGKCRYCGEKISPRYLYIELLTGILFTISYHFIGLKIDLLFNLLMLSVLVVIAMIDIDTQEILERTNIFLFILAIIRIAVLQLPVMDHVFGMFAISVPLFVLAYFGAMGGGDVKLMAAAGLYLGLTNVLVAGFIGVVAGGIAGAYLMITHKAEGGSAMAFGPYLCLGIYTAALFGQQIISWYLSLIM